MSVVSYRNSTSNHNEEAEQFDADVVVSYRNSTSNHNYRTHVPRRCDVVSYRNSTSNHNLWAECLNVLRLYLIEILHQTTTGRWGSRCRWSCILSKFYIKPQHLILWHRFTLCCILSKFYIKPQPGAKIKRDFRVVSYRNSTSNHNTYVCGTRPSVLYLIEILHQTTTRAFVLVRKQRCILSKFYIKPQHDCWSNRKRVRCILSKFYIKPQHTANILQNDSGCILSKFYIKPQLRCRS